MNREQIISEALCLPPDAIDYHVSQHLLTLFPEKSVVQGDDWIFDVDKYARAQLCGFEKKTSIYSQIVTEWQGLQQGIEDETNNAWMKLCGKDIHLTSLLCTGRRDTTESTTTGF